MARKGRLSGWNGGAIISLAISFEPIDPFAHLTLSPTLFLSPMFRELATLRSSESALDPFHEGSQADS